jgi:hypothetical protein
MVAAGAEKSPEAQQQAILERIRPPRFPDRDFEITKFGGAGIFSRGRFI